MNELGLCSYWGVRKQNEIAGAESIQNMCIALHSGVSRVLVVDVAVEESHNDIEHWRAEAHFITGLTAEHPDPFGFHGSLVVFASLRLLLLACPL